MTTLEKLNIAMHLVKEAVAVIDSIDNESFDDYHGYSREIVVQQLDMFADNQRGTCSGNTNLEQMIDGLNFENKEEEDYVSDNAINVDAFDI